MDKNILLDNGNGFIWVKASNPTYIANYDIKCTCGTELKGNQEVEYGNYNDYYGKAD